MSAKITGLVPAPFTPMYEDGSINYQMIELQYAIFRQNRISTIFLNGSTGEGLHLTIEERKKILETWCHISNDTFKVIAHVGHVVQQKAKEMASHAQDCGVYAISTVGPFYMKPLDIDNLIDYCADIANSAPEIPFYYYHIPQLTHVNFNMVDFLRIGSSLIPNLAGIKFTSLDFLDYSRARRFDNSRFDLLYGNDELMINGFAFGARGFVGSTYNLFPKLYFDIIQAIHSNNDQKALKLQETSIDLITTLAKYGYSSAAKSSMKFLGIDFGPCRSPLNNLSDDEMTVLREELSHLGFFEYALDTRSVLKN